jgi:REP element-mobilizing transposase RayT
MKLMVWRPKYRKKILTEDRDRVENLFLEIVDQFDEEFQRFIKKQQGGHLWEQGYFFRTIREQVTEDVIRKYIEHHR